MLASGIISILFACMVGWEFPASSFWLVGTLVGFSLLTNGLTTISLAAAARKVVRDVQKVA
jgi:uncharacterized membrane protein HdeD (DUF308 family)